MMKNRLASFYTLLFILASGMFFTAEAQYRKEYYPDSTIKSEGLLVEGKKEGVWKFYYPDQILMAKENYRQDNLDGGSEYFDFQGHLSQRGTWKAGIEVDSSFQYFPNGLIKRKGIFSDGLYEGEWVTFNENGTLHNKGTYIKGTPEGLWLFYDESGKLKSIANYKGGVLEGSYIEYAENGTKKVEGTYS
ncbi:MAG TPA: toxin-antitoxin system YwqK family antitoxin, partial [Cytophagaceae bacterium]